MKPHIIPSVTAAVLAVIVSTQVCSAAPGPGAVDFGSLPAPGKGGEFIEVHVGKNLISMVTRLAGKDEPEVADVLRGLEEIRVNVVGLSEDNRAELEKRVKSIRADLAAKGWERVVSAQKSQDDVGVYLKMRGDEAVEGVVVTVLGLNKQAIFVNVVGDLRPEKLGMIGERFNIDPLKKLGGAWKK